MVLHDVVYYVGDVRTGVTSTDYTDTVLHVAVGIHLLVHVLIHNIGNSSCVLVLILLYSTRQSMTNLGTIMSPIMCTQMYYDSLMHNTDHVVLQQVHQWYYEQQDHHDTDELYKSSAPCRCVSEVGRYTHLSTPTGC